MPHHRTLPQLWFVLATAKPWTIALTEVLIGCFVCSWLPAIFEKSLVLAIRQLGTYKACKLKVFKSHITTCSMQREPVVAVQYRILLAQRNRIPLILRTICYFYYVCIERPNSFGSAAETVKKRAYPDWPIDLYGSVTSSFIPHRQCIILRQHQPSMHVTVPLIFVRTALFFLSLGVIRIFAL
jgi:hypothetical protein